MNAQRQTASYRIIADTGGNRYQFFCDLSGALCCVTGPIRADTQEKELQLAWEEGRPQFNRCHKCGRWVCDAMYNADVLECVDCAPWEETPHYCIRCGREVLPQDVFCRGCGTHLQTWSGAMAMTERLKEIRHLNMDTNGFGPHVMTQIKVCTICGTVNAASQSFCRECGHRLPPHSLYCRYREMHRCCPVCDTVLPDTAQYCSQCGKKLKQSVVKKA